MKFKLITLITLFYFIGNNAQEKINIDTDFDKIIVSPHIEAVLIKGDKSSIEIEDITVPIEKFKYELKNNVLQVYLEGAKTYTKNKKVVYHNSTRKVPLYKNKVAKVIITYTNVETFSLRGEEKITIKGPVDQNKCKLRIYGKSEVEVNSIDVNDLRITIFGDGYLNMKKGNVEKQKITAYGASKVMVSNVKTEQTKITTYGDGVFQLNASEKIKVTSFGEATVLYKGNAELKKGIVIGEATIRKID